MARTDFSQSSTEDLESDVSRDSSLRKLEAAAASRAEQDNSQRNFLFWMIMGLVGVALISVIAFIVALVFLDKEIDTAIGVAFISGVSVQSFLLIGFLTRGLFPTAGSRTEAASAPVE